MVVSPPGCSEELLQKVSVVLAVVVERAHGCSALVIWKDS